jgi:hypothetical protein
MNQVKSRVYECNLPIFAPKLINSGGFIGVLSPKIISKFDFKTKPYVCIAEINLEKLLQA